MIVVAELDKRQVATADGCRTLTDWISSRLDLRHDIASQLVSASRNMPEPLIAELGDGTRLLRPGHRRNPPPRHRSQP